MKSINWQKVVTREFSFLWASYTIDAYKVMKKLTGTTLKYNLFHTEGMMLTIYRNQKDIEKSYNLIENISAKNSAKVLGNMDKFEFYFKLGKNLLKKINRNSSKNKKEIRKLLLDLDKTFLNIISYYLFVVFLGYAGDLPGNKKFLKAHKEQFERIRMCSMDADFHSKLPIVFSKYDKKLQKETLYMSRAELLRFVKGQRIDWKRIKSRHRQAVLVVKNGINKEYPLDQIKSVLNNELKHLRISSGVKILNGMVAFKGKAVGSVVKIMSRDDYKKIKKNNIVVIPMTKPDIVPYLKNVKGIITNDGGALSHASIIAREMRIPCVVGTKYATDIFKNGDKVILDAKNGRVKKLN